MSDYNKEIKVTSGSYVLVLTVILITVKFLANGEFEFSWYLTFSPMILYLIGKIIIKMKEESKEK